MKGFDGEFSSPKIHRQTDQPEFRGFAFERLEPRLMLSADVVAGGIGPELLSSLPKDIASDPDDPQALENLVGSLALTTPIHKTLSDSYPESLDSVAVSQLTGTSLSAQESPESGLLEQFSALTVDIQQQTDLRKELIFVDEATPDYAQLVAGIGDPRDQVQYQVVMLNAGEDGIGQISRYLESQTDIDAIHLISHGSQGSLQLGKSTLNLSNLGDYQGLIAGWSDALGTGADLLIYGCNLTGNADGQQLALALGSLTGADIAASDDVTGSTRQGGDWVLEYQQGLIETEIPFDHDALQAWQGTLAPPTADASAGAPYIILEGSDLHLDASSSMDDGTITNYEWDLLNDGSFEASGMATTFTWAGLVAGGIDDDGIFDIALRVTDDGAAQDTQVFQVTVNNAAPTITTSGATSVEAGELYTLNLSVSDPGNETISGWTINWGDGTIDTVALNPSSVTHSYGQSGFTYNISVSVTDEDGSWTDSELLVGSWQSGDDQVFSYEGSSGLATSTFDSTGGELDRPYHAITGPDGSIYVSGYDSDNIVRFDSAGNYLGIFATGNGLNRPDGLAFGADGHLYVANFGGDNILKFDGSNGNYLGVFGSGGDLNGPAGLAFGPDGDLYVSSWQNGKLVKFDGAAGGSPVTLIHSGIGAPEQIAFDAAGDLYITTDGSGKVKRWDGSSLTTYFSDPELSFATGLTFGPDGWLYVGDYSDGQVLRYDGISSSEIFVAANAGGLTKTEYLSFTPSHQVLVTANNNPVFTATGAFSVDENAAVSTTVGDVDANDGDGGGTDVGINYTITANLNPDGDGNQAFVINPTTGVITVNDADDLDFEGVDPMVISVEADDGVKQTTTAVTINLNDLNENPSGAGSLISTSLNDNAGPTNLFGGLTVGDVDGGENDLTLRITLSNASAGVLSGGGFSHQGGGVYTASGLTVAQANTALDNVTFTPTDNSGSSGVFSTDISVEVDDGDSGYQSVLAATTVNLTRVNDDPTGSGSLTSTSLNDNAGPTNLFGGLTVSDVDGGENDLTLRITLSNASAGVLSGGGFSHQGGGVYTASGLTVAQANTALDNVTFTPTDNSGSSGVFSTDISVEVDDGDSGYQSVLAATTVNMTRVNDDPTGSGSLTSTSLNDNAGPTNLFGGLTVSDVDTGENDLSLRISLSDASAGVLSGGGFSHQGGGVYTASGLTVAQANTALDNVQFTPSDNSAGSGVFSTDISVEVDDGDSGYQSVLAATTVNLTRVNDDPTGSGSLTSTSLNDNAGPTNLFGGLTVSDVDGGENDLSLRISLSNASAGVLSGGGFSHQGGGVYTAGGLTVAQANTALDNVTFTPTDNSAGSGVFSTDISVEVDDGDSGYQSVLAATTVNVTRVNVDPTGSGSLTSTSLNDNAGPTSLFGGLTVSDLDTGENDLSLRISLSDASAGVLSGGGFSHQGGGVYTAGGLTVAQANTALDNVQFTPTNNSAGSGLFSTDISVEVDDGDSGYQSVLAATTINVTRINDDPSGSGSLTSTSLNDNAGATSLFGGLTVSDVDGGENDLSLRISLSDASAGALSGGGFSHQGGGVYTVSGLTVAQANTALDNVQFTPTNNSASSGVFSTDISVEVDDGDSGYQSVLAATTINVTRINDDPTLDNAIADQIAVEDAAFSFTFAADTFGDADAGDTLTYTAQLAGGAALPGWLSFDGGAREFTGTPLNGDVGMLSIEVSADDGHGGTLATADFEINVANSNDDPTLDNAITDQLATEDIAFSFTFAADTFSDVDVGDTLTYSARLAGGAELPGWLSFDSATRTFSGTPLNGDVGTLSVEVSASDGRGGAVTGDDFNIVVGNINDAPKVTNLNATSGMDQSGSIVALPDLVVSDEDSDERITATLILADIEAGALSANDGASFDSATGIWSINGTVSEVNNALRHVVYIPASEVSSGAMIRVQIDDGDEDKSGPVVGNLYLKVETVAQPEFPAVAAPETADTEDSPAPETVTDADTEEGLDVVEVADGNGVEEVVVLVEPNTTRVEDTPETFQLPTVETNKPSSASDSNKLSSNSVESKEAAVVRLREQFVTYQDPLELIGTGDFLLKLNDLRDELVLENRTSETVVGGSLALSAGMSVGYVVWLARSGVLLSSIMTSLPAWRFMDPLPVLANMNTEHTEQDRESLESMVEVSSQKQSSVESRNSSVD